MNSTSLDSFLPHGLCYLWNSGLVALHLVSDALIGLSYVAISATLTYLVYRARRDIPFHWVFLAFGVFIVACGATHFMEIWTLWTPSYWVAGEVKLVTAVASVATALVLPPLVPKTLALIRSAKLSDERKTQAEAANRELERLYAQVKHLDALRSQFFANVSHELRTPLMLIEGPVDRVLKHAALAPAERRGLEVVKRNAKTLLKHVNDLLDIARLDAGRMELHHQPTDIAAVTRFVVAHFDGIKEERSIDVTSVIPDSLPVVIDRDKYERILFNLLSNAFKFIGDRGRIVCSVTTTAEQLVLDVQDNGPGIPSDQRAWIFDRFRQGDGTVTRKFGGTGLGLAITKEFVALLDGTIAVEEAPGGGARFTVTLPLVPAPPGTTVDVEVRLPHDLEPVSSAPVPQRPRDAAAPRIVVVEDHPEMADFIQWALGTRYHVAIARNGREGLALVTTQRPDLILTDIMMPEVGGEAFIAACREDDSLAAVPIIVLTAKADHQLRNELLKAYVQDYLSKPFSVDELAARIERQLAQAAATRSAQARVGSLLVEAEQRNRELNETHGLLVQSAKMAGLGTMAAGIAHELNNPLNNIGLYVQNALDQLRLHTDACDPAIASLEKAVTQVDRAARIIRHLRTFARRSSGQRELVVIRDVVYSALELLQQPLQFDAVAVEVDVPMDATAWANKIELEQVLVNLLSNAHDAMKESIIKGISIAVARQGSEIQLQLKDTGCGMPPEVLDHIFDPFFTTKPVGSGTGLGLSIVYAIIADHGGGITVSSQPGKGTIFTIRLPATESGPAVPARARANDALTGEASGTA